MMDKLVVVEGDVQRDECGLSADDLARLRADVDIVIHSAASISFFEHIHVLLQQNYQVCSGCYSWSHRRALARQVDSSLARSSNCLCRRLLAYTRVILPGLARMRSGCGV